jgi:putative ABC transport system permease protein
MRLSSLLRLYRVRLRARVVQELFAILGIAIGVALLFASQVASTSLDSSVEQLTSGIVGPNVRFQLAARGPDGFDEALLQRVQSIPGVRVAVPVLEEDASVIGPEGRRSVDLIGTDPRLAHLGGPLVRSLGTSQLARVRAFALPAPIAQAIGVSSLERVKLQFGASLVPAVLAPALLPGDAGALAHSPIAIASLGYVQKLTGMAGRLSSVFVQSPPARDREVRAALERLAAGRLNVRPANFNAALFRRAAGPTNQSTGLFSAISALVGFLFAFNALLLTVPQRRDLIGDLRLDGYTRRMIVEVLLFDALLLGLVACVLGLLLGELLSVALFDSNPGYLAFAFPIGSQRIVTWQSIAWGVGGGMLAAFVGVLVPLRDEIFSPMGGFFQRRRGSNRDRRLWFLAGASVCLAITTVILIAAPRAAILGIVSLTLALCLFLPVLLDGVVFVFDHLQRPLAGASPYLAVIELGSRSNRARSLAVAATGAIAVFGSVSIQTAHSDLQNGLNTVARGLNATTDVWISPAGEANALATIPFTGVGEEQLARLPGVRAVHAYRGAFLDIGDRRTWILGPPRSVTQPIPVDQLVEGDRALASARIRAGGWIVLSRAIAAERHLRIGDSFTLPSPRPTAFRLAATSTNLGWPSGAVMLNAEDYARAWGSFAPSAFELDLAPGTSPAAGALQLSRALRGSGLKVQTAGQREESFRATGRQGLSRLTQISVLMLIAAVLAMAATMSAMIWQRRPRLADLKVDGFDRGVLWRALLLESGLLLGAGCSIGAVFGIYGQLLLSRALATVTGFPVAFSAGVTLALGSFALVTATAILILAIPGGLAARVRPAISFRD